MDKLIPLGMDMYCTVCTVLTWLVWFVCDVPSIHHHADLIHRGTKEMIGEYHDDDDYDDDDRR